ERAGRARVDAEGAGAAVGVERRRGVDLGGSDERSEHDPGAVTAGDQQRVLAVEADARARGRLAVDVLVRVDEDSVLAAELVTKAVQGLAENGIGVAPRVARETPLPRLQRWLRDVVAVRGGDDGACARQQRLGVTRYFRLRHREPHVGEKTAGLPFADVTFGVHVRRGWRGADDVEAELLGEPFQLG